LFPISLDGSVLVLLIDGSGAFNDEAIVGFLGGGGGGGDGGIGGCKSSNGIGLEGGNSSVGGRGVGSDATDPSRMVGSSG
jgi:hypothetical protein